MGHVFRAGFRICGYPRRSFEGLGMSDYSSRDDSEMVFLI